MGIENFFNTIIKTKMCPKTLLKSIKLKCDYLFIDFNSIIYLISNKTEKELNYYLYSIIINSKDEFCLKVEREYNINLNSLDEFKNYFTQELVDSIIKFKIYEYIKNLCKTLNNNDNNNDDNNIKELFISFDGTPTMSKIAEQRRRKYTSYILSCMRKNIYEKYKDTIDESRKIYYDNVISFGKKNQWYGHIQDIYNNIDSFEYKNELKNICKKLKDITISSSYEFGEGEKKILEHIIHNKKSGSYVIFSPDADTILLSLIMQNKLLKLNIENEFNILKYDENEEELENISINMFRTNILDLIYEKLNPYRKFNHNKINIINDIIALFTFFGNDFIPKIESMNIRNGMHILIDIYIKQINFCRLANPYLLFEEKNITKINYEVFINIIEKLSENEDKLIFDKYISSEYKNFNYLLGILKSNQYTPFFIDRLNRYCHGFNKIIRYIKTNKTCTAEDIYTNIINNFTDKEQWETEFLEIENKDSKIENLTTIDLLNLIIERIKTTNQYRCGLKLIKYTDTIDDKYHQKNIIDNLSHSKMTISDYDIQIYKLEKMMDEYKNIGSTIDGNIIINNIGICNLKYRDNEYKIHTCRQIQEKKNIFYKNILNCKSQYEIDSIIEEYIKGFFWTIDFYFNKTNRKITINNISIWNYGYNHAPYFKEIKNFIKKKIIKITN